MSMTGALWYLVRTTGRNRLRRQAARLRNPRYVVAFVLGLGYFWFLFFRPGSQGGEGISMQGNPLVTVFAPLFFLLAVAYAWIFGSDKSALAFTPAEVALLFPAPVSRRALILYKLARSQIAILFTVFIWVILLGRGDGAVPAPLFGVTVWAMITTFSLHRLGVALVRSGMTQHGTSGARRSAVPLLLFAAVLATVGAGLWLARAELMAAPSFPAQLRSLGDVLQDAPAGIALLPLHLLIAPLGAEGAGDWLRLIGPALIILGVHLWWVLRTDAAFEEAAVEASVKQAKALAELKARQSGTLRPKLTAARRTIPLAPTGAPAVAILWKNAIWLHRTGQVRSILLPPALALAALVLLGRDGGGAAQVIAAISVAVVVIFLMVGPLVLRNDLRADLLQLSLLKTLPLRARDVVFVQILGTAAAMTVGQVLLVFVGAAALSLSALGAKVPAGVLAASVIGSPLLLLALNAANFTIHNGMAVVFPGWVRLGDTTPGGVESMGQLMLVGAATILALVLMLLLPALLGTVVVAVLAKSLGVAIVAGALVATAALAGEVYLLIVALAGAYERVEPMQTV